MNMLCRSLSNKKVKTYPLLNLIALKKNPRKSGKTESKEEPSQSLEGSIKRTEKGKQLTFTCQHANKKVEAISTKRKTPFAQISSQRLPEKSVDIKTIQDVKSKKTS